MLSVEEILTLVGLIDEISPKDQKSRNQLQDVKKYIVEHAEDPDYVAVEDSESDTEDEEGEPEEHIIDRTDPNFIAIK
tara:strand:- start:1936 stop:2169 length:234 start_codon:yes stop_codon:yes gene_type:complete